MHNRTNTPDILGSIMSGNQAVQEVKPLPKTERNLSLEDTEEKKEKATFNLPVTTLAALEDISYELRKLCKSKQVSKTLIVEEALKIAFADFEQKRQASKLFINLASNKNIKQ